MSENRWIKSLVGGLVILILGIASSKDSVDECRVCCILQETGDDLNCTWTSNSSPRLSVFLQSISSPQEFPQHYSIPPSQNWLLIHREKLTLHHKYQLSINGENWTEVLNFTYCSDCENVLIRAPVLNSSVYEEDDTLVVDVTWTHLKDHSHPPVVELRYRMLGASAWILVHSSDMGPDSYQMTDPEPYTDYEFQIRYIASEEQQSRSLWSEHYVLTTPEEVPFGTLDIWRRVEQENSLTVIWKPLSHHFARGKILSYNVSYIHNKTSRNIEVSCCNTTLPAQSTNVCVSARNSIGRGPHTCVTSLCSVAADMGGFNAEAWGDPSGCIAVWWQNSMIYGDPVDHVVEWRKENSSEMDWITNQTDNQTLVLPGNFTPGVLYLISVHVLYTDSCAKVFSTETYSREEVPIAAPTYSIDVLSPSDVFISWDELPRHNLRGKLLHYTIYVTNASSSQRHTVRGRNITLSGLLPSTEYHTFMTASTAAGEGVASEKRIFYTKGVRNLYPAMLILVFVILKFIVVVVIFIHLRVPKRFLLALWPKIPKPDNKFNGSTHSIKNWGSQQDPPSPPIAEVEEMEASLPASPPPPAERREAVTSGYEKHFMPTPEEVMGLC